MKKILLLSTFVLSGICFGADNKAPDVNGKVPGTDLSLLNFACVYNLLPQVEILLKAGANPNIPAPNGNLYKGNYPLHFAAMHLNNEMKTLLIQKGADPKLTRTR